MTKYDNKKKNAMLVALEKTLGVISEACRLAKISRETHYRWLREDEEYKKDSEATKDLAIEFAETALHKQIANGNPASTIFLLKTLGKKKGYVERLETTGPDGSAIKHENVVIEVEPPYIKVKDENKTI